MLCVVYAPDGFYTLTGTPASAAGRPKRTYAEYLRSPHWQDVRRRYRASKLPQACVVCGEKRVDLHHRTYARLGRERLTDLVPLCREHHGQAHEIRTARGNNKRLATAKQIDYIRRLGGTPPAEMTQRQAQALITHFQKLSAKKARKAQRVALARRRKPLR